jgi:uncharacterized integral membrane protein
MASMPTAGGTETGQATAKRRGVTISPKMLGVVVILVAAIWFILVNRRTVSINLWVPQVTAPLWLVLLITFVAGLITGLLIRRGRRQRQAQR